MGWLRLTISRSPDINPALAAVRCALSRAPSRSHLGNIARCSNEDSAARLPRGSVMHTAASGPPQALRQSQSCGRLAQRPRPFLAGEAGGDTRDLRHGRPAAGHRELLHPSATRHPEALQPVLARPLRSTWALPATPSVSNHVPHRIIM